MDFYKLLYSVVYSAPCSFADLPGFVRYVAGALKDSSPSRLSNVGNSAKCFSDLAESISPGDVEHGSDETALATLISEELARLAKLVQDLDLNDSPVGKERLQKDLEDHILHLQSLNIEASIPFFTLVDAFPPPFDKFTWSAFCPDEEDESRYGIKRGIYFRRDSLRPHYSRILLAHELVHTIPGRKDPEVLAMGLEEGLAEIIGSLYLAHRVLPSDIVRNVFIYGRHGSRVSTLWKLYLDHGRQAALVYYRFGIQGLIELLKRGRREIHQAEMRIIEGRVHELNLPKGDFSEDLSALVNQLFGGYLPHYVFKPLEAYLMRFVEEGRSVKDLSNESNVPLDIAKKTLSEVSGRTVLFILDGDKIAYSNVHQYRSYAEQGGLSILRYEVR